ncbi:serine hydrolase [Leekyejoonella antrihumi]|uniref:serine hydrolase n=1 Tax=Leekyejoonella antrihumi TaxID=1660198 RepID=UPI0016485D0A|nr:serine hydrolase [Leekyejoonella antrihumi]
METTASGRPSAQWKQIDAEATSLAPHVAIYAANVSGHQIQVIHRSGPENPRPLASMVKLYVLYAVADAVQDGRLTWKSSLTLEQGDKAAGSGSLAGRPAGAKVTLQQAATLMMHISDNTATDLLIRVLGQKAIARAIATAGNSHSNRLAPLPTIKQDLWLEWSADPRAVRARKAYPTASPQARMSLLQGADRSGAVDADLSIAAPQWQHGLGYFASASDIAKVLVLLHNRSAKAALRPLREILDTPENGIMSPASWTQVAFKGGTVAGVQTGSWYAETRQGGQLLVVMASSSDGISADAFSRLATDAAGLLARD